MAYLMPTISILLTEAIREQSTDARFDLNIDDVIDMADHGYWVTGLKQTFFGDANLDLEFNSTDLVAVLASGTYEADVDSSWTTGDFNGDLRTNSTDLVIALSDGGYEQGPRAAVSAVPEPGGPLLLILGMIALGPTPLRRAWQPSSAIAIGIPRSHSGERSAPISRNQLGHDSPRGRHRLGPFVNRRSHMKRALITSSIVLVLTAGAVGRASSYNRIVDFGESLSDAGNQWIASEKAFPPSPPYYNGRWSNGPNWIDLVSARLGLGYAEPSLAGGTNFAYGGARSGSGEIMVNCGNLGLQMCFDLPSPNYGAQIDDFLNTGLPIKDDDLFVFWGGHNDMSTGVEPQVAADNLTQHLTTLLDHGASDVVFLDLFDGVGESTKLNDLLTPRLETLRQQYPDATIIEVDIPKMTDEFFNNPSKWGITDFGDPALNTAMLEVVDNANEHLVWDGLHFTSAFNKVIADYVLRAMDPLLARQGDFDGDDALATHDIDSLTAAMRAKEADLQYDLNFDGAVDATDHGIWVTDLKRTYFGDANLDGEFNSGDLITVLAAGTYEVDVDAGWASGDFDGSGRFDSGDLIVAMADGGYEQGPRVAAAVPEPTTVVLLLAAVDWLGRLVRRKQARVDSASPM